MRRDVPEIKVACQARAGMDVMKTFPQALWRLGSMAALAFEETIALAK